MAGIAVIGAGFSGLSAACYLAQAGHTVEVFEKNATAGGRARQLTTANGYVFDMGPSWYWMPDIFDDFFSDFNFAVNDFYELKRLDPAFSIVFGAGDILHIPDNYEALRQVFESIEAGAAVQLDKFMDEAKYKYDLGMKELAYLPGLSIGEFASFKLLQSSFQSNLFGSISKHIRRYFSHPRLIALMEFPVLFLGATPENTPALYSLMNYAGLKLGTWYPRGGFGRIISSMQELAVHLGVRFHFDTPVEKIIVDGQEASGLIINEVFHRFDAILASADYHHVEKTLLSASYRNYTESYWEKRTLAPSCLIYFLGVSKRIENLSHHTLFFDENFALHGKDIYTNPQWPQKPLFYVSCTSQSDDNVAPKGHENLFLLMPIAAGLPDPEDLRETYFDIMIRRIETHLKTDLRSFIDFKKSYSVSDFVTDYHSYKGNAYGLANTLGQTAILKPKIRNKKIRNLFYAGQLTVPGPGVPPSLISGKIAAKQLNKHLKNLNHEIVI